jgi:hypothetical protein
MFKVMTWNLENLFKPGTASGPSTRDAYETKLQGLAATINGQAPDALAVQEVGDPAALDDLVGRLHGTWHGRVSGHPDQRHIRVAWLTRRTITQSEDISEISASPQAGPDRRCRGYHRRDGAAQSPSPCRRSGW